MKLCNTPILKCIICIRCKLRSHVSSLTTYTSTPWSRLTVQT